MPPPLRVDVQDSKPCVQRGLQKEALFTDDARKPEQPIVRLPSSERRNVTFGVTVAVKG